MENLVEKENLPKSDMVKVYHDGLKDAVRMIENGMRAGLSCEDSFKCFNDSVRKLISDSEIK